MYLSAFVDRFDLNNDGAFNVNDVTALMKHLIGKTPANFVPAAADLNDDGSVNAKDVTSLMNYIIDHR